jgi:hypothetical protein
MRNLDGFPKPAADGFPLGMDALSRKAGGVRNSKSEPGTGAKYENYDNYTITTSSAISTISGDLKLRGFTLITSFAEKFSLENPARFALARTRFGKHRRDACATKGGISCAPCSFC